MTEVQMSSEMTVKLIRASASDEMVVQAAKVSVIGENNVDTVPERLINSLMRNRHGVPFEHTSFTFFVEVPIFVARQWVKHRMSSLNEVSGRYTQLIPKFYVPEANRPMINLGTKMDPKMAEASYLQHQTVVNTELEVARVAWRAYESRIKLGIAEEMARSVLPVSIYTQFYWTLNARSLMNFLERRVEDENARVISHPQWEIQMAALQVQDIFAQEMPITANSFLRNQRVAP